MRLLRVSKKSRSTLKLRKRDNCRRGIRILKLIYLGLHIICVRLSQYCGVLSSKDFYYELVFYYVTVTSYRS